MRCVRLVPAGVVAAAIVIGAPAIARGDVDGAALLRMMGPRAGEAFAPRGAPGVGALVRLPDGVRAGDVGLREAAPGIGRLYGSPASLLAFADAHPGLTLEVAPPLRLLLDTAGRYVGAVQARAEGLDGSGAIVGIADTGVDVTHHDFIDAAGHTRVAWLLDLSAPPRGKYPTLEKQYGTVDAQGNVVAGAVWDAADIDAMLAAGKTSTLPQDEVGHGTLVASCAAGNGELGRSAYVGIAPKATIVVARIAAAGSENISNDDLLRGVDFLYDRADNALHQPIVVNLSIGSDFGPHDGSMAWEQTLASYVGPSHPGHAMVAAAGNSGSIADTPVHQNIRVSQASTTRVPLVVRDVTTGGVEVWISMHDGSSFQVGLDAPDGSTWIAPVSPNQQGAKNTSDLNAGIYNGSGASGSPVPSGSRGAVIVWQGQFPAGTYEVTLTGGEGTADLYAVGTGDAGNPGLVGFAYGVRESTINLPATNASIIGVGCTMNKSTWASVTGLKVGLAVPVLDATGGIADLQAQRDPVPGEPCWFSSAGPTLTGIAKPEIMAPGAAIVGAMSSQAVPPGQASIFTNPQCPAPPGKKPSDLCQQIDATHAVSFGTSFSSPVVAGAVAVLLQHDPTLTQDEVLAALQGGAHPLRGAAAFEDQAGPGEVDVLGAVRAADRNRKPQTALPVRSASWLTLGADVCLADGSTPVQGVVELRTAPDGSGNAEPADGIGAGRLAAYALVDGQAVDGAIQSLARRGPGVWIVSTQVPPGLGGSQLTVGVTLDGRDVVMPRTIPIAADAWDADYGSFVKGGCAVGASGAPAGSLAWAAGALGFAIALGARRLSGRTAASAAAGAKRATAPGRATSRRSGRARA
ncbi:MAG TPA: S8 family serine peptidase [Polyangiaceae bacterium]